MHEWVLLRMETITPLSALASLSASGSPCEGIPLCPTEASASCLPPTSEEAKTSLFSKGLADDNDDDTPDVPACALDLEALIANIQLQLSHRTELPLKARLKIKELMRLYDASTGELDRYTFFDPSKKYTRNLISCDDTFTLMLLCWNPAVESPIHDHPCRNGCYVKVVDGTIREHQYVKDEAANKLTLTQVSTGSEGDVLYIDDGIGFHKVGGLDIPQPFLCAKWSSSHAAW